MTGFCRRLQRSRPSRQAGLTLVEGVFTTVIAAVLFLVLYELQATSSDVMDTMNAQGVVQMELSRAADYLQRDVASARAAQEFGVFAPWANPPYTIILFVVPSIDASGQPLAAGADNILYGFHQDNGTLERRVIPDATSARPAQTHVIARHLTTFDRACVPSCVAAVAGRELTYTLTGQRLEGTAHPATLTLSGRVRFRNAQN